MMMAMAAPPGSTVFLSLLECLEDSAAGLSEHTDAYLTIAGRLSGEEGRQFLPAVEQYFSRLGKATLTHITSPNVELSQAALQALGFCVYHSRVVKGVPETFLSEILSALCSLAVKSKDKNTCTRALWVISKQSLPPDMVAQKVSSILETLECVWSREDIQSVLMEHEALNVVIRLLEQVPAHMGDAAVQWAKLLIPLVVHSAAKVRLRAAAALEMGMPLLLKKQSEVSAIIEPIMSSKLIPELQKLFMSKNETNVLKLWPLFVKLLGKLLHRGGPFINSLLHLEELGFRSSSPIIKKIAFIAWKSLIDNFALNPEILCSGKRMKLLMQPLISINVRTEALLLTKVEVWWYLIVQLGPNLSSNFDQVSVPLLQCTIGSDSSSVPGTPSRAVSQNGAVTPGTPGFNSAANTSRMSLNSSIQITSTFPSIQLLGLEMLLHYFLGPEVIATAAKNKLILSLEPLNHPLLSSTSSFTKHAAVLTSYISDGFISIGKDASESLLAVIWRSLMCFVNSTMESVGNKKDRHCCEVLTLMLQTLQSIVTSETVPADKVLILVESTVESIPQRVLGSASYQVGKMDVLNGTPALFLILLLYNSSMLSAYIEDKRFLKCFQTLVDCGLSGPTSPLAFGEAVLGALSHSTGALQNKEQLWMMWNAVVSPLTERITESNEVNQGDALEHNFSAMNSALLFPITHLLCGTPLQQVTQKTMLSTWSKLYKVFARCSALVITAEENICCEELCAKMIAAIDREALKVPSTLNAIASILQVMVECVDFSPYTSQFQQKLKSPHTPVNWVKKRNKVLGNLSAFQSLLLQCLQVYLEGSEASSEATGLALVSILSVLFTSLALANTVKEALTSLTPSLTIFYQQTTSEQPRFTLQLLGKLERLIGDVLGCLQTRAALAYDDELLAMLSPLLCVLFSHNNKQLRTSVTQFWNSTFANAVSLTYPDEIRPILSQVKQRTPLILPGFEVVSDELSGQYSSESSQLETKLSGIPFSTVGKRDSLLEKGPDLKDKKSVKSPKPVSTKLDFGSPKPPCREFLEEEASIDFVFIPPETKHRILTEHQKEVKRTKRFDIPAMYNNLDASLDTTVFTQYTQSQEDSLDKVHTERFEKVTEGAADKVPEKDVENKEDGEVLTKETQYYASPKVENLRENKEQDVVPELADVSIEDSESDNVAEDMNLQSKEDTSPNISCYSDLVLGTPQKPNSRRQSFITLEKYPERKPACPAQMSTFIGPLIKTTNSQECSNTSKSYSSLASHNSNNSNSLSAETGKIMSQNPRNNATVSPLRTKDSGISFEPVRLTDRMPSDTTEDSVIPDTQTGVEEKECKKLESTLKELKPLSQEEEESQQTLDNSETSVTQTFPGEPRRSGRCRVRPLLPGEDPEEREEKYIQFKRRNKEEFKIDSLKQSGPKTRSRQAAEETTGKVRLRRRGLKDQSASSQTTSPGRAYKIKLYSNSEEFLEERGPTRSTRESSQTELQSDCESQSLGKCSQRSKASLDTKKEGGLKRNILTGNEESSQTAIDLVEQTAKDDEPERDSQKITPSPQNIGKTQMFEIVEPTENDEKLKEDSQLITCSPQTVFQNRECELIKNTKRELDSQTVASSSTIDKSLDRKSTANRLKSASEVRDRQETIVDTDDNFSQEDSQVNTISSSESHFLRRSRRSKALSETAESEEKSKNKVSSQIQSRSNVHTLLAVSLSESTIIGRTRRNGTQEVHTKSNPLSIPESSQSQNVAESKELSQGRGRYLRRRSSQALVANVESSESESSEPRENVSLPKNRGKKLRASRQSLPNLVSKDNMNTDTVKNDCDTTQADVKKCKNATHVGDWQKKQDLKYSDSLKVTHDIEDQSNKESQTEVDSGAVVARADTKNTSKSQLLCVSPHKEKQTQEDSNIDKSLKETDTRDLQTAERLEAVRINAELSQEKVPCDPSWLSGEDEPLVALETAEILQCSQEKFEKVPEPGDCFGEKQNNHSDHQECQVAQEDTVEGGHSICFGENQMELSDAIDYLKEKKRTASIKEGKTPNQHTEATDVTPLQEIDKDSRIQTVEFQDGGKCPSTSTENDMDLAVPDLGSVLVSKELVQGSPVKQKDLEALGPDFEQSPSSSRTRGAWSPSASPSTSILKKAQKRPLEDETPSPLVKSRRVSFADPIQQQKIADDIDRRSPAVRTSSPRRSKNGNIPQPKYITTPTKGLLILSPRNLHTPGYKSSKKCLISEMNQEQHPASRDCIYPALVGCSAPVEAVLPQISSNMWSRGFGQLVRARNIKTVGDLSALTPCEIKTLPIRLPKISNVKKALKIYEQQRKGRGGDELKSFDETEMMTSELEETSIPQNQDEDKTSNETLATELSDESVHVDGRPAQECSGNKNVDMLAREQRPEGQLHPKDLLPELEALACKMTPLELRHCSAEQLVQMYDQFGGMMRRVVVELQARLCHTDGETLE